MLVNCCPELIGGMVYFGQVDSGIESDKELLFGRLWNQSMLVGIKFLYCHTDDHRTG